MHFLFLSLSFNIIFLPQVSGSYTHDAIVAEMCFLIYQITHTEIVENVVKYFFHRKSHSFLSLALFRVFVCFFFLIFFVGKHQLPKLRDL